MSEELTDKEIDALALKFAKEESYGKLNGDLWKGFVFGFKKAVKQQTNVKLYTEEQVIEILWECVDNIESSYNIHEVTEEFIKNRLLNQNKEDE